MAYDIENNILILNTTDRSFPSISVGNSDLIKVGQKIFTVGSPLGFENTITEGIVSGIRADENESQKFIQISAPISPGSSGGAVVNSKGELIGITTLTFAKGQNLNLAIPINEAIKLYSNKNNIVNTTSNNQLNENVVLYPILVEKKYGYINRFGKIIIQPQFEYADDFSEDLAKIKVSGKYGFINKKGEIVITRQFDDARDFLKGMAVVKISKKYGYINKKGEVVITSSLTASLEEVL